MIGLVGKIAITLLDVFIKNEQTKRQYAKRIYRSLEKWNVDVKKSADLREMFERIEREAKEGKSGQG